MILAYDVTLSVRCSDAWDSISYLYIRKAHDFSVVYRHCYRPDQQETDVGTVN